jgi:exonuclease SbcC
MIPQRLTLKNFLSYREATLDFRGLHVACICGANGAGKSSLLEAIAWAVWGQSRTNNEEDVIHQGTEETQVDLVFQCYDQTYRILRTRHRKQPLSLEFQIETPQGWRSLTGRGMRATQLIIQQHIKLDYETFINSAYLRQGRADEFMLKRPAERKQILADLLKLMQYDDLEERARERSRLCKAELAVLERNLQSMTEQIQQGDHWVAECRQLEQSLEELRLEQAQAEEQFKTLLQYQHQRQAEHQELQLQIQQQQHLQQECHRLDQEWAIAQQQQQSLTSLLNQAEAIARGYAQFQALQTEDETLSVKLQQHQTLQHQIQELQHHYAAERDELRDQVRQIQLKLETLEQQRQELQTVLNRKEEIQTALGNLRQAREHLQYMNALQFKAAPLLQRQQQLQRECDRHQAQLGARLENLKKQWQQLRQQQACQPQLQHTLEELNRQLAHLEQRRIYHQQVRDKGFERRTFMERLQANQRTYERQMAELDHKIHWLQQQYPSLQPVLSVVGHTALVPEELQTGENHTPEVDNLESRVDSPTDTPFTDDWMPPLQAHLHQQNHAQERSPHDRMQRELGEDASVVAQEAISEDENTYPLCPLCDRPLDEHHWQVVLARHQAEREEIRRQLWVVHEQLTVSQREIQVLRQEYREVERELAIYNEVLERRGQIQAQLQSTLNLDQTLAQLTADIHQVERSLQTQTYAPELQEELRLLEQSLQVLNYDDKNHALARGEVERWRWAEAKHHEWVQAQRRDQQLQDKQPDLERAIAQFTLQLDQLQHSPMAQQLQELEQQQWAIAYDANHHAALRATLRQMQHWPLRYQEWQQAQQHFPQIQQRVQDLQHTLHQRQQALASITQAIEQRQEQLQQQPDQTEAIQHLEQQIQERRSRLEECFAHLGRVQQQQDQIEKLRQQFTEQQQQLLTLQRQTRVYHELAQAFGKNGIQALMIENILPQLEAETNHILGRLSAHQLHIQFVTQRAGRRSNRQTQKLIDTLDILISDVQGTRPYETYSGGEAFRINFAIRLALARLLAQRSGAALQLLVIDEGFGTQDAAGCDRLIAAINAIAPDFSCILVVTHMPQLKAAFETRIEVEKDQSGSQLTLIA